MLGSPSPSPPSAPSESESNAPQREKSVHHAASLHFPRQRTEGDVAGSSRGSPCPGRKKRGHYLNRVLKYRETSSDVEKSVFGGTTSGSEECLQQTTLLPRAIVRAKRPKAPVRRHQRASKATRMWPLLLPPGTDGPRQGAQSIWQSQGAGDTLESTATEAMRTR